MILIFCIKDKFSKASRDSAIVSHVLEKIRVPIVTHWSLLKKKLRYLDPMGTSRIEKVNLFILYFERFSKDKTAGHKTHIFDSGVCIHLIYCGRP